MTINHTDMYSNKYIQEVLNKRGINPESLRFEKEETLDWKELQEVAMKTAMKLIHKKDFKNIGIEYDPDVDGVCSGYVIEDFLVRAKVDKTKVHRFMNKNKVHGFSDELVDFVNEKEIDVLFVVDAGSSDTLKFAMAMPNTEVIILDHHEYEEHQLPENHKVTKLNVHDYDHLPSLSGCGVVYRFVEAMNKYVDIHIKMYEIFVGMSVLSDSCDMTEPENRYYVLQAYRNNDYNAFLRTFKNTSFYGSNRSLFSFKIIPYLNALIRMNYNDLAMKIFNDMENNSLTNFIPENFKKVKAEQDEQVDVIINSSQLVQTDGVSVLLRKPSSEIKTLNGLVANKIMSKFKRSAMVLVLKEEDSEKEWKGSFRGLDYSNQVLTPFGFDCRGHDKACGVTVTPENLRTFVDSFEYVPEKVENYDIEMTLEEITKPENAKAIAEFNEFASGNIDPIAIKVIDEFNPRVAKKVPRGSSGKFFIISLGSHEITDFTPDSVASIPELIVTVNLSTYNPYSISRIA